MAGRKVRRNKDDRKAPQEKTSELERLYLELLNQILYRKPSRQEEGRPLPPMRQPSALKIVDSVTTYGAYEKPI